MAEISQEEVNKIFSDYDKLMREEEKILSLWNNGILSAVERLHGKDFIKKLKEQFEEDGGPNSKMCFVDKTDGHFDQDLFEETGLELWIDQYCNGGYTGDSYAGYVFVRLKKNRFLKYHYTM